MANTYFQFKQFIIHQDQCAMKVGTDGALLGAWSSPENPKRILDIGSGTGLISLMMAQRYPHAMVTGIEIDESAYSQSVKNVADSQFHDRVKILHGDLKSIEIEGDFDHIVSNPPFFINSLLSNDSGKNKARHTRTLSLEDILSFGKKKLSQGGSISLILPSDQKHKIQGQITSFGFHLARWCEVHPTPTSKPKRILMTVQKSSCDTRHESLVIEKTRHHYSEDARVLFKDFYLNL